MCIYCKTTRHRKIYENHIGPVPKEPNGRTYDIHHMDGNHSNNSIENLNAVTIQEHYDIHYSQGDWGACSAMSIRMGISSEDISRLASLATQKRVDNGTHPFLGGEIQRKSNQERLADGSHHLLGGRIQQKQVEEGKHHFLDKEKARERALKQVADGIHNFLNKENARERNIKRLAAGTHPFQKPWKCEHCGKEGKGPSYNRYQGES